jgi:hypothetical protein
VMRTLDTYTPTRFMAAGWPASANSSSASATRSSSHSLKPRASCPQPEIGCSASLVMNNEKTTMEQLQMATDSYGTVIAYGDFVLASAIQP